MCVRARLSLSLSLFFFLSPSLWVCVCESKHHLVLINILINKYNNYTIVLIRQIHLV